MKHQQLMSVINEHDFTATASELHGLITGLIAGGMFKGSEDYLAHLADLFNNGMAVKGSLKKSSEALTQQIFEQLASEDMSFELMLLDDDEILSEQAEELINWVQYFLVGFGLNQRDLKMASNDVREIIEDFTNITRMDPDLDDTNESQGDYYEVVEFIRVSAVLIHQEFGKPLQDEAEPKKTLH